LKIYSAIDEKPKSTQPILLRRVSNIIQNPNVCFIVDDYVEDWRKLRYVLVMGNATILKRGERFTDAIALLRRKYSQYNSMKLETRPLIKIRPLRIIAWKSANVSTTVKPKGYD
jgi:PPOX class probable F420-dependent enzyme